MEGLANEVDRYLEENPKIISLFKIDVVEMVTPYIVVVYFIHYVKCVQST